MTQGAHGVHNMQDAHVGTVRSKGGSKNSPGGSRSTLVLVAVFVLGLCLLLYPTVSDWWNSFHQSKAIVMYNDAVSNIDNEVYEELWAQAVAYNERLALTGVKWTPTEEDLAEYNSMLAVSSNGVMGYIEIPEIDVYLPIYHGTSNLVLQSGVGHIEGSSLPVGGTSSHTIVSGHRGLPSAKLLTNLDRLELGDTFMLHVLDETLTYEVDQILIVEPGDLAALSIVEGQDYCTLVTCTPYGINTHRLLVRGHRVETQQVSNVRVPADAYQIDPVVVAPLLAAPMLVAMLAVLLVRTRARK